MTAPRNSAPTKQSEERQLVRAADVGRGAEQRDRARDRREEIEAGIELRAVGGRTAVAVVGSASRRRRSWSWPRRAPRAGPRPRGGRARPPTGGTPTAPSAAAAASAMSRRADVADGRAGPRLPETRDHAERGEHAEHDPQQPSVAEADLAPASGDPAEERARPRPTAPATSRRRTSPRSRSSVDDGEVARCAVQPIGARVGRDHDVFEPHAEPPGEVDAGLHAERVAGNERRVVARDHVRVFVRLGADAVTGPVDERVAVSRVGDDAPRRGVDVLTRACRRSPRARRPPARRPARRTRRAPRMPARRPRTSA